MTAFRRPLLRRLLVLAALGLPFAGYTQEAYPAKPVTLVVPYAPGGGSDAVARLAGVGLGSALSGTFIVENKPGASGSIALGHVARSKADGYTLALTEITSTVTGVILDKLPFDPATDLVPIALVAEAPYMLVVNKDLPVNTLPELVAYARANPGKLNYGSGGVGSGPHIAGELLKSLTKTDMRHVPFRGSGPALQALLGGHIQVLVTTAPSASHVLEGRIKALAVARSTRLPVLPNTPTADEAGLPGFHITNWYGLAAPKATPDAVVKRVGDAVMTLTKDPAFKKSLEAASTEPLGVGPDEARKRVAAETAKWSALLRTAGVKPEKPGN